MKERNLRIDTLRGLACLLLVAYHTVGDQPWRGLHVADGPLRWMAESFVYLRMPLFTFLSGYVYAMRPARAGDFRPFVRGKARRLLLPLLCVGLLYLAVQNAVGGVNANPPESWLFLLYPYEHYWYLQALFLIFLFIFAVDASGLGARLPALWALVAICVLAGPHVRIPGNPFSVENACLLLPYFLLGVLFRRQPALRDPAQLPRGFVLAAGLATVLLAAWQQAAMAGWNVPAVSPALPSGQVYSLCSLVFVYALAWRWRPLAAIGGYSYSIYLFHVFGTAGSRIVLTKLGVENLGVLFACGMLAGVLGPIVAERLLERFAVTRTALLGRAWRPAAVRPVEHAVAAEEAR